MLTDRDQCVTPPTLTLSSVPFVGPAQAPRQMCTHLTPWTDPRPAGSVVVRVEAFPSTSSGLLRGRHGLTAVGRKAEPDLGYLLGAHDDVVGVRGPAFGAPADLRPGNRDVAAFIASRGGVSVEDAFDAVGRVVLEVEDDVGR